MSLLALAAFGVAAAAGAFAAALPPRGTLATLGAFGLFVWAIVLTTMGVAGLVLRDFDPLVLVALAAAWAVAGFAVALRRRTVLDWPDRPRRALSSLMPVLRWLPALVALGLVGLTLVWRAFLAVRLPVVDYDGWSYHLVFADVWLQHSAIVPVLQRPWTAGYPADAELVTTWLAAFAGNDDMAGFTSLLPIPLAVVGTMGLARAFGAGRQSAALSGLVFGMTPALVALAGTSYVDIPSVAAVLVAWWVGLRVIGGERDGSALLQLGIGLGLAVGTKGTNALLVGPIGVVVGLLLLRTAVRERSSGFRSAFVGLALLSVPVVAFGGSWYLKNLASFGNPLYPFALGPLPGVTSLGEFQLSPPELEGKSLLGSLLASWTWDWQLIRYPYNVRPGGLGRAWPFIAVLAVLGAGVLLRHRRGAALMLVVLPATLTLFVMPMPWYARLTLFLPAVGLALVAVVLDELGSRLRLVAGLVIVGVAAISLTFANIFPNVDLRPQESRTTSFPAYLRLLRSDADQREGISLRAACAAFDQIPAGARVASDGFSLLHAGAGHDMDRVLTESMKGVTTSDELLAKMRVEDADWLVTAGGGPVNKLAARVPELEDRGESCEGSHLWRLRT